MRRIGWIAAGVVVAGIGTLFFLLGLENADRISSGIGAAAGLIGLIVTGMGAFRGSDGASEGGDVRMRAKATKGGRVYQAGRDITHGDG